MKYFKLTENNDWEGERWRVHFKVDSDEKTEMILRIKETLDNDINSIIEIVEIKEMPIDGEPEENEVLSVDDFMEDEYGDVNYYEFYEGYFPLFQNRNVNWDVVEEAKDMDSDMLNNFLYKLKMFE